VKERPERKRDPDALRAIAELEKVATGKLQEAQDLKIPLHQQFKGSRKQRRAFASQIRKIQKGGFKA